MIKTHNFIIPDYYLDFKCKTGECRSACCVGWPVHVSMREYFELLGLDCDGELRKKIDCSVRVVSRPTIEEYARFEPRYDGNCPLRKDDGKCLLHATLGEDVLPNVCALYPRGVRFSGSEYLVFCANSCEKVLELLFDKKDPITFKTTKLSLRIPDCPKPVYYFETFGKESEIREKIITVLQDRRLSLKRRLVALYSVMSRLDDAVTRKDEALLNDTLNFVPRDVSVDSETVTDEDLMLGLKTMEGVVDILDESSESISKCGKSALKYFNSGEPLTQYYNAKSRFESAFPSWETFYENMLVNHVCFSGFPFQDRPLSLRSEYFALCGVYAILRFLGLGSTQESTCKETLIDGLATTFRLIDHTEFDRYALNVLNKFGSAKEGEIDKLINL